MYVLTERGVFLPVADPPIIETLLPNLTLKAEFPLSPKRKTPFDELQRPLQR
jgi:hypothetical protein